MSRWRAAPRSTDSTPRSRTRSSPPPNRCASAEPGAEATFYCRRLARAALARVRRPGPDGGPRARALRDLYINLAAKGYMSLAPSDTDLAQTLRMFDESLGALG